MTNKTIIEFAFVWYEELCRPRRVWSTDAGDNTLLGLHNSSYYTQPHPITVYKFKYTFHTAFGAWCVKSCQFLGRMRAWKLTHFRSGFKHLRLNRKSRWERKVKGATSTFVHFEKNWLNFLKSLFPIRFNLRLFLL